MSVRCNILQKNKAVKIKKTCFVSANTKRVLALNKRNFCFTSLSLEQIKRPDMCTVLNFSLNTVLLSQMLFSLCL